MNVTFVVVGARGAGEPTGRAPKASAPMKARRVVMAGFRGGRARPLACIALSGYAPRHAAQPALNDMNRPESVRASGWAADGRRGGRIGVLIVNLGTPDATDPLPCVAICASS